MNIKIAFIIFLISSNLLACSVTSHREVSSHQPLPAGGRMGLHGMVVFGNGSYFMEHIPMLHPPHDYQIVASIQIKNKSGAIIKPDLSQKGFTLKPKNNFPLNDLIEGELKSFKAELYSGSFEQKGELVLGYENITVEIQNIKLSRQLPKPSNEVFFEVTDAAKNVYRTSIITPENNIQVIRNTSTHKKLWCVIGPDFFESCPSDL